MSSEDTINLTVSHRSQTYHVQLDTTETTTTTVHDLQERLFELTSVPIHLQKLIYKGKKNNAGSSSLLRDAGVVNGAKITLLGNPESDINQLLDAEKQQQRKEEILRARAAKAPPKIRSAGGPRTISTYRFHRIEPLRHMPDPSKAEALLKRLSEDQAIRHVMEKHKFSVGLLTELAPHEHPGLLGLNKNAGESIHLRLRTDAMDGFRLYSEVRRVLCHELTHNVWGDHDDNFKALNSRLNREVAEFERQLRESTHTLMGGGPVYTPTDADSEMMAEATSHVLGGGSSLSPSGSSLSLTPAERRARVLEATLKRLQAEEQHIEDMCGSSHANTGVGTSTDAGTSAGAGPSTSTSSSVTKDETP
ncbi:hypothetical protein FRC19_006394 [Serendipita sp. 401]|nr:hypothetical protein FRC15_007028 [Serendipita sp. 397]KAG8769882.1 hypothetical protein FRC16_006537 [Serendipita sp. 398]KAG8807668.1 hypothetical protein FRC19_006394 [Serendipita sp. 401]